MERAKEVEKLYTELGIIENSEGNGFPSNDLKTDFPTRFKNISVTTTCVLSE